jgi:hypothetical protein
MSVQSKSTFLNPCSGIPAGYMGAPIVQAYDLTALTATGTITVNVAGTNGQGVRRGVVRIKSSAVNGATTIAIGSITGTDGTNTVQLGATNRLAATAAGVNFDLFADFVSDLFLTSLSFTVTLAGGTTIATINTEVYGSV